MAKRTSSKKIVVPAPPSYEHPAAMTVLRRRFSWRWVLVGLLSLLAVLFAANKGWVVVAVVEGKPIFSWQLNTTLRTRYGQQTLEGMIGEALIAKEAGKAGVVITDEDLRAKQTEVLSSLGTEMKLEDFLKFQGMSERDFNQQLRIQATVERLLTKDLAITETDIDTYIATNRALLMATQPAQLREEARRSIIANAVSEKIQSWFMDIRKNAKVFKFL